MIATELGVSPKIMFDFDKPGCFQGTPEYLFNSYWEWFIAESFPFAFVCLNDIMLVYTI